MQDDGRRMSSTFPDVFPISLSHSEFPYSYNMASVDELGTPLGCIITPYIQRSDRNHLIMKTHPTIPLSSDIARCFNCQSYINPFCDVSTMRWYCSLCRFKNVFPRKSTKSKLSQRYIKVGTGILPETQDILVDYPMPYRAEIDGLIPKKYVGATSIPADERPLIHIFLIQETMALDAMEAVVEGLSATIGELHPDIQVVLLSYSNRIGIHYLSDEVGVPTVQYVHMATSGGQGKIFEGNEMPDLLDTDNNGEGIQDVTITVPLSDIISFKSVAKRIGDCRQTLEMAIASIFDSEPINTDSMSPQNHIGPVLQAISDWVLKNPDGDASFTTVDTDSETIPVLQTISNIRDVTLNLLGLQGSTDGNANRVNEKGHISSDAPIDSCSGVVLNLFISSKQDLPHGAHDSVEIKSKKSKKVTDLEDNETQISPKWSEKMGRYFSQKSLSVNIWAVTSFDGQEVGLWGLSPIAKRTGGFIHRCVLGDYPKDERCRFTKLLTKVLKAPMATKCIMKLRTSHLVDIDENGFSGHATPDEELPDIFRIASCTPDKGFAFSINYKHESLLQDDHPSQPKAIILQIAFSYDTLVEDDHYIDNNNHSNNSEQIDDNNDNNDIDRKYIESISEILSLDNESVADIIFSKSSDRGRAKQVILREDGEYYNLRKKLVSVRRLRTITIMIECTPRMSRMIQVAHTPTMISLITRQAIMLNNLQQREGELILDQRNDGAKLIIDWGVSIVHSIVTVMYKNYLDAQKMNKNSADDFDPYELVSNAVKHLQGNRCLQALFGAFDIMARTCMLNDDRSDSAVELSALFERLDSYHTEIILYPSLFPVNKKGNLEEKIPLKRESMITCAAQSYLLDAGYELVYYQNISSTVVQTSQPPQNDTKPVTAPPKWGPPTIILNNDKVEAKQQQPEIKEDKSLVANNKDEKSPSSMLLLKIFKRITLSDGVPRMYAAEAGTSSSRYLTSHLLEDSDYYKTFIDHVTEQTLQDFKSNNNL